MNCDNYDTQNLKTSLRIDNEIKNIDKSQYNRLFRIKDKSDRATVDQVLDARISRIIYKLMNKGELTEVNGCISTGKEANVYYATGPNQELAIKIYKTSILIFKDRERYISGEFRFRHGYCKKNPRKMVAVWAEKEVRNLKRVILAGINCPKPLILKSNLIVMEFIGKDGVAAPRLKDADINSEEEWDKIYIEIISILRTMFKKCKLVHSDFSEYNILYFEGKVFIIDMAQAVEDDHINALSFLKRDCHNINAFFNKNGVETITDQQLFDIISTFEIKEEISSVVEKNRLENQQKMKENNQFKEIENGNFLNFYVPRTLMEEDLEKITENDDIEDALKKLCGVVADKNKKLKLFSKTHRKENITLDDKLEQNNEEGDDKKDLELSENEDCEISDEDNENESENEEESEEESEEEVPNKIACEHGSECKTCVTEACDNKRKKFDPFDGMSKFERKKKVKDEKREKRMNKKLTKKQKEKMIKKTTTKNKK